MAYLDFINYIEATFFSGTQKNTVNTSSQTPAEQAHSNIEISTIEDFKKSIFRPLRKTIRLNFNQVNPSEFIESKTAEGWTFTPTPNPRVF